MHWKDPSTKKSLVIGKSLDDEFSRSQANVRSRLIAFFRGDLVGSKNKGRKWLGSNLPRLHRN